MVSISACHAEDPGSIPGLGVFGIRKKPVVDPVDNLGFDFFGVSSSYAGETLRYSEFFSSTANFVRFETSELV